jgi:hypothetical protein
MKKRPSSDQNPDLTASDIEIYTPERIAESLLSNAVDAADYDAAADEVRAMGLDPDAIPHERPSNQG